MSKSGINMLIAAAVGMAAGIGIGILIAPAKGSKTRKRLKKHLMEMADQVQDEFSEKMDSFKSAIGLDHESSTGTGSPDPQNAEAK